MKRFMAFLLVTALIISFQGCGARREKAKNIKVGVLCYARNDTFINELMNCYSKDMGKYDRKNLNFNLTVRWGNNSQRTQNSQAEELIEDGAKILIVNLVDRTSPSQIIDIAKKNSVPVIFFNREPVNEDLNQWDKLFYIGAEAGMSGDLQGELASSDIKKDPSADKNGDGKIQYVVLQGQTGHQDSIIRTEKSIAKIKEDGIVLDKLCTETANWNRSEAESRMQEILEKYPGQVELVLSNNDDMALGAVDAYNKMNISEDSRPLIYGIDGSVVGLNALLNGAINGTVYNDKVSQAAAMAELSYDLALGKDYSDLNLTDGKYKLFPYKVITRTNAEQFKN